MALTTEHLQRVRRLELDKFFTKNKAGYLTLAEEAYDFAVKMVTPTGEEVRVDDVAAALRLMLDLNKKLTDYLASKHQTQKYWTAWFGDYVLDQLWEDLTK